MMESKFGFLEAVQCATYIEGGRGGGGGDMDKAGECVCVCVLSQNIYTVHLNIVGILVCECKYNDVVS